MKILFLGGSYTGRYMSEQFGKEHEIAFLTRRPDQMVISGFQVADHNNLSSDWDVIVNTTPPQVDLYGKIVLPYQEVLSDLFAKNNSAIYQLISTTSVYPPGKSVNDPLELPVVNEDTRPAPLEKSAQLRLNYEKEIQQKYKRVIIIRSGGIYGPSRSLLIQFASGNFMRTKRGNSMVARIHVCDLCRLILASAKNPQYKKINGVDLYPSLNSETFQYLEELLGIYVPGEWRTLNPSGRVVRSLYAEKLLGNYEYPGYRDGFQALFNEIKSAGLHDNVR